MIYNKVSDIGIYNFKGLMPDIKNHFHKYYVIGFIEEGARKLYLKNKEYMLSEKSVFIFNPYDSHACEGADGGYINYKSINISEDIFSDITYLLTGNKYIPYFENNIIKDGIIVKELKKLSSKISKETKKETAKYMLIDILKEFVKRYSVKKQENNTHKNIEDVCIFLENNYKENITLTKLQDVSKLNKYYLSHCFKEHKGISLYNYLESVRIDKSISLLKNGFDLSYTALQSGFFDQSHYAKFFKKYIGVSPKKYIKTFYDIENITNISGKTDGRKKY